MPRMRFLAVSADPRPDHQGTVYGPGHETDYLVEDYEYLKTCILEGKAELLDGPPPPELFAAPKEAKQPLPTQSTEQPVEEPQPA